MTTTINVNGMMNTGRTTFNEATAIGPGAVVHQGEHLRDSTPRAPHAVGVITILPVETLSVRKVLDLTPTDDGFYTGERFGKVVCVQAHEQGQGGAMNAARRLLDRYSPSVVVVVGVGGGISPNVRVRDVVISTKVVGYDMGKETAAGRQWRGRAWEAPAVVGRAVDAFFADRGAPVRYPGFLTHSGIVGSGNTVLADGLAIFRTALRKFNDKIVVVDMESDGIGQFCHDAGGLNWLSVRGISDDADHRKNDDNQELAATHAATVLRDLLSYLPQEQK
jgi:adenosylhomocysteine nucleosidase